MKRYTINEMSKMSALEFAKSVMRDEYNKRTNCYSPVANKLLEAIHVLDDIENKTTFVFGDYVLSGCKNAFNSKMSWWLSKKGYTTAMYCFSTACINFAEEAEYQANAIEGYIKAFNTLVGEA